MREREFRVEIDGTAEHLSGAFKASASKLMEQLPAFKVQLIGSRVSRAEWRLRTCSRRSPIAKPFVEFSTNGMDGAQLEVQLTMHRKVFGSLPSLHGADVPMQIGGNLLPPAQRSAHIS